MKYLAAVRDQVGYGEEKVDFPQGTNLWVLKTWLNKQYALSMPNSQAMAALNGKGWEQYPLKLNTQLEDGDIICLFPIISGG